jgi:hypothetical protein
MVDGWVVGGVLLLVAEASTPGALPLPPRHRRHPRRGCSPKFDIVTDWSMESIVWSAVSLVGPWCCSVPTLGTPREEHRARESRDVRRRVRRPAWRTSRRSRRSGGTAGRPVDRREHRHGPGGQGNNAAASSPSKVSNSNCAPTRRRSKAMEALVVTVVIARSRDHHHREDRGGGSATDRST